MDLRILIFVTAMCIMNMPVESDTQTPLRCHGRGCSGKGDCSSCTCYPGYEGENCTDVNECLRYTYDVCWNRGYCVNYPGSFRCDCMKGWSGQRCMTENETVTTRTCMPGYTGDTCETLTACEHGNGRNISGNLTCYCHTGWTHVHVNEPCNKDIDECQTNSSICKNGNCTNTIGSYNCSCQFGWFGHNCSYYDACALFNHCQNGGTCITQENTVYSPTGYKCSCTASWQGENCTEKVTPTTYTTLSIYTTMQSSNDTTSPTYTPSSADTTSLAYTPSSHGTTSPTYTPSSADTTSPTYTPSLADTTSPTYTPSSADTTSLAYTPSSHDTTSLSYTPSSTDTTSPTYTPSSNDTTSSTYTSPSTDTTSPVRTNVSPSTHNTHHSFPYVGTSTTQISKRVFTSLSELKSMTSDISPSTTASVNRETSYPHTETTSTNMDTRPSQTQEVYTSQQVPHITTTGTETAAYTLSLDGPSSQTSTTSKTGKSLPLVIGLSVGGAVVTSVAAVTSALLYRKFKKSKVSPERGDVSLNKDSSHRQSNVSETTIIAETNII